MSNREQAEFPSRLTVLAEMAAFAQTFCERNGVDRTDALRLTFIIEELFTNTIRHGFGGDSDSQVRIELVSGDGELSLLYEDSAPPYDPIDRFAPPASLAATVDARPIGGLGVYLLGQLISRARYAYEDGCNRLWLIVPREG